MNVPTLVRDRLNPRPSLPIGCQHHHTVDITDFHADHDSAMCNDCGAHWSVIPEWRRVEGRTA